MSTMTTGTTKMTTTAAARRRRADLWAHQNHFNVRNRESLTHTKETLAREHKKRKRTLHVSKEHFLLLKDPKRDSQTEKKGKKLLK